MTDPSCRLCTTALPAEWVLAYLDKHPATEGTRETLLTVGNGYLATRGAAPEVMADGTHLPRFVRCRLLQPAGLDRRRGHA